MAEVLRDHGIACDEASVHRRFVGRSMASVVELLASEEGFIAPSDFPSHVRAATFSTLQGEGVSAIPGIVERQTGSRQRELRPA
jgi:hypothetical protein